MAVEKLKEYAGVMVVAVMLVTTLAAAGQWAIHAQVRPEINRLDGRVDNYENLYEEIIGRLDRMERRMDRRFARIDERFRQVDDRFKQVDDRFIQLESRLNQRFDDMAANMNLILTALSLRPRAQAAEPHEMPSTPKTE